MQYQTSLCDHNFFFFFSLSLFLVFIWFYLIQLDYGDISFDDRIFIDSREANILQMLHTFNYSIQSEWDTYGK